MFNFYKGLCGFALILTLSACSNPLMPMDQVGEASLDDFMNAMRWKRFPMAASYIKPEHRQDFMDIFTPLKDIHIVDVRLINLKPSDEDRHFETLIEMDYYLLPSVTIQTFNLEQIWEYFDGEGPEQQGFQIITPFPDFP